VIAASLVSATYSDWFVVFSARSALTTALLTCFYQVAHVERWANVENAAVPQGWMLGDELYGMIHVARFEDENAAELFLGFRKRTVGGSDLAVFPIQGQGGFRRLKGFPASPVSVGAQMVVVLKAFVEHGVSLVLGHDRVFCWLVVSQTDVFHAALLLILQYFETDLRSLATGSADLSVSLSSNEARHILM
jgi:hypothetical protein